jgi:hypothetical protein
MGWEFAALWNDDADAPWQWVWRRIADDSGQVVEESRAFANLDGCMADAKQHGFENDGASKP